MLAPITPELVTIHCEAFDRENEFVETALLDLRERFPENANVSHVLLKVVTLNQLYHARVRDKDLILLSWHISTRKIDPLLTEGSPEAVERIWSNECSQQYYSFATKYCSWHNRAAYPMQDGNVVKALSAYRKRDGFAKFTQDDLYNYERLIDVVTAFRKHYGLESLDFKDIDKFLWRVGDRLIKGAK